MQKGGGRRSRRQKRGPACHEAEGQRRREFWEAAAEEDNVCDPVRNIQGGGKKKRFLKKRKYEVVPGAALVQFFDK